MAESSATLHEPAEALPPEVVDRHRAVVSVMEELEAIDWYDQRISATGDPELAAILAHNRDEEKEHAAMTLEWLRRRDPVLDQQLRTYLFTARPVPEVEEAVTEGARDGGSATETEGSLGIGSLRSRPRRESL